MPITYTTAGPVIGGRSSCEWGITCTQDPDGSEAWFCTLERKDLSDDMPTHSQTSPFQVNPPFFHPRFANTMDLLSCPMHKARR